MTLGGVLMVLLLGSFLGVMWWRETRRRSRPSPSARQNDDLRPAATTQDEAAPSAKE